MFDDFGGPDPRHGHPGGRDPRMKARFGPGGRGGFAFGGPWGHGQFRPPFGPRARRGDVRAAIISLLKERPMHGYEMIGELESRTNGVWRPSPGSVYPTLQLLEDQGLVASQEVEGKRTFSLTEAGTEEAGRVGGQAPWEHLAEGQGDAGFQLGSSIRQLTVAAMQVAQAGSEQQQQRAMELLNETRRRLYAMLGEQE
ncbi:MAG TPA: PadR family transcriptional regulator [Candidatus Dormibacteraeota bacterium]|jgi:DNA-binding PadR family transcriptional regulator|nr:PadR family transcriptional regulator [Candidatus Dormibacteraeota bacterium]